MIKHKKTFKKMIDALDTRNHKCYDEHKTNKGKCYGLSGGDSSTCFLNCCCVGCRYLTTV